MKRLSVMLFCLFLVTQQIIFAQENTTYRDEKYTFAITYPSSLRIIKNYQPQVPLTILLPTKSFLFNDQIIVTVTNLRPSTKSIEEMLDIVFKYDRTVEERMDIIINDIKFTSILQTQAKKILFFTLQLKLYHLITAKGNRLYTITYIGSQESFDKQLEGARNIMRSFKFT